MKTVFYILAALILLGVLGEYAMWGIGIIIIGAVVYALASKKRQVAFADSIEEDDSIDYLNYDDAADYAWEDELKKEKEENDRLFEERWHQRLLEEEDKRNSIGSCPSPFGGPGSITVIDYSGKREDYTQADGTEVHFI